MIEIYKLGKAGLETTNKSTKGTWTRYSQPTETELQKLKETTDIPEDFLAAVQDIDEAPFIERHNKQINTLIRIPIKTGETEIPYRTIPLGIILTKEKFITICYYENEVIPRFKTYKTEFTGLQPLLRMLYASARTYLSYLKEINKQMNAAEHDLEKTTKNEDLLELFELEKSLIYFTTAVSGNRTIIDRLSKITEKHKELLDDVTQEYKQAAEMTKIYSIVVTTTMDTFTSIISNNLNKVIKTLTVITIILMLPTLVASIYGMNIQLPFQNNPHAFAITMTASILLSIIGVLVFRNKALF